MRSRIFYPLLVVSGLVGAFAPTRPEKIPTPPGVDAVVATVAPPEGVSDERGGLVTNSSNPPADKSPSPEPIIPTKSDSEKVETPEPGERLLMFPKKPLQVIKRSSGTIKRSAHGRDFYFITDPQPTFTSLSSAVCRCGDTQSLCHFDLHFNASADKPAGPQVWCNVRSCPVANTIRHSLLEEVFRPNNWKSHSSATITKREQYYAVLSRANSHGYGAAIIEPFFRNGANGQAVRDYFRSPAGHRTYARVLVDSCLSSAFRVFVFSAGHHSGKSRRGTSGTEYDGYHEIDFAFDTFNAMAEYLSIATEPKPELDVLSALPPK